jgi:hypothetical protein
MNVHYRLSVKGSTNQRYGRPKTEKTYHRGHGDGTENTENTEKTARLTAETQRSQRKSRECLRPVANGGAMPSTFAGHGMPCPYERKKGRLPLSTSVGRNSDAASKVNRGDLRGEHFQWGLRIYAWNVERW